MLSGKIMWLQRLFAVLSVVALAACSGNDIDPEDLPAELVKFEREFKIKRAWRKGVGDETERLRLALRPSTDGRNIYAASHDGRIVAFNAEKGSRLWKSKTRLPLSAGPATDGSIVVAGSSDGDVIVVDAAEGEELWRISVTSEVLGAPAIGTDSIFIRTVNGKLAAFSKESGEEVWAVQQSMPRLSVRGTSAPVISGNLVISGFDNGRVVALDQEDGSVVWDVLLDLPSGRSAIERLADVNADVSVVGGDVYAVSYQGRLGAIALESGQQLWTRELSSYNGLAVDLSSIYVSDQFSELVAMSRGSGRELWRKKDLRNRGITTPAMFNGSVVVGDFEGYLHWFDSSTGDLQARARAGRDRITAQPLVLNDLLYVVSENGSLYAFRVKQKR